MHDEKAHTLESLIHHLGIEEEFHKREKKDDHEIEKANIIQGESFEN